MNKTKMFTRRFFVSVAATTAGVYIAGRKFFGPIDDVVEKSDFSSQKPSDGDVIVSAAIYPGIGVTRVGNSLE